MTDDTTTSHPVPVPQITLPGQAATPDGALDMSMMYVMHHAFRRDLRDLAAAAARTPLDADRTWTVMARRWGTFAEALHHHHQGEDAGYWPLLTQRVGPEDLATLREMEAEHAGIDPLLAACAAGVRRMADPALRSETVRASLVADLRRAGEHLGQHLAHEETTAIPLLHAHLTPEEDERIEREHFRGRVSLRVVLATVPWAMHRVPETERRLVMSRIGLPYLLLWRLTRRRFERADRRLLRHV